jgi:hypothetical protein
VSVRPKNVLPLYAVQRAGVLELVGVRHHGQEHLPDVAHERAVIEYDASIRHAGGACAAAASHRGLPAGILQVEHINFLQVHSKTPEHSAKLCRRSAQRTRTHPTRLHRSISPPRSGVSEAVPATRDLSDLFSTGKRRVGDWLSMAEGDMLCPTSVTVYAARASLYPAVDT